MLFVTRLKFLSFQNRKVSGALVACCYGAHLRRWNATRHALGALATNKRSVFLWVTLFIFEPVLAIDLIAQEVAVGRSRTTLQVPAGSEIEFLGAMDGPRFLTLGPDNELLIGSNHSRIYRWAPPYIKPQLLVRLAGRNHSVVYRNGRLYVAETESLLEAKYSGLDTQLTRNDFSEMVKLPSASGGHWSRTVVVGPDEALYLGIGISGNCVDEYLDDSYPFERRRGGVFKIEETADRATLVPFSSGLRNPIGLAFDPRSDQLFATNAGSDDLGFDLPREVFSQLTQGSFHGMPWFQYIDGSFQAQSCIGSVPPRTDAVAPKVTFDARSTPQGIAFVPDDNLVKGVGGNAIVAIHGSWGTPPGGGAAGRRAPNLSMVVFSGGEPKGVEDFVTGFQRSDGSRFARPSGVLFGADGYLYFTSDGGDVEGLFRLRPAKDIL